MKRTSVQLILILILASLVLSFLLTYTLYEVFEFILPIRPAGVWGIAIGFIFSWTMYFSLRQRFPKIYKTSDEIQVVRAKNPLPQLMAARISVLSIAITRSASIVVGIYSGIGIWAFLRLHIEYIKTMAELSLLAILIGSGIVVSGVLLERLCSPPSANGGFDSKQAT